MNSTDTLTTWALAAKRSSPWQVLLANRAAAVSATILILLTLVVIVGPWLSPHDATSINLDNVYAPPSLASGHWFGTDGLGRDLLVRTLKGGQISLLVGLVATVVSIVLGLAWGATAGYLGGRIDNLMMRVVDVLYAIPFMFFVILLMVLFGRNFFLIFVAIGAINWLDTARIVRGQTLSLKQQAYVEAARVSGVPTVSIIVRHIVPNLAGIVAVYATLTVPQVILIESFLSFLGLGVQPPMTSWGGMVNEGVLVMEESPWNLLFPGALLAITLFCCNFLGDGMRDAFDPRRIRR